MVKQIVIIIVVLLQIMTTMILIVIWADGCAFPWLDFCRSPPPFRGFHPGAPLWCLCQIPWFQGWQTWRWSTNHLNFISGEITVSCWYALKVFLFLSTGAPSIIFSEPQMISLRTAYPLPTLHPPTALDSRRKHPRILHLPPAFRRRRHHSKFLPDAMWLRPTLNHRLIAVLESIEKGLSQTLPLADPTGTSVPTVCNAWPCFRYWGLTS